MSPSAKLKRIDMTWKKKIPGEERFQAHREMLKCD